MDARRRRAFVEALLALGGLWLGLVLLAPCLAGIRSFPPADLLLGSMPIAATEPQRDALRGVRVPHLYDVAFHAVECAHAVRAAFRAGDMPFRNPWFRFGAPLLGNGQSAPFSPFMLPVWILPWPQAFAWSAVLRLATLWGGAWIYARLIGLRRFSALFLCVGTIFLPAVLGYFQHPNANALAAMSLQFAALEGVVRANRRSASLGWAALLALATATQLLGGHYQPSFCISAALLVYAVVRVPARPLSRAASTVGLLVLSQIVGACIAAPAILPFLESLRGSFTLQWRHDYPPGFAHLPAATLWHFVDPFAFGDYRYPTTFPWKGALPWPGQQQYVGFATLILAPFGIAAIARGGDRARVAAAWIAVGAFGVAAAYGTPIHDLLARFPLFRENRAERFCLLLQMALVALAGIGLEEWVGRERSEAVRSRFAGGIAAACLAVLLAVAIAAAVFEQWGSRPFMVGGAALLTLGAFRAVPRDRVRLLLAAPALLLAIDVGGVWARYFPCPSAEWFRAALETPSAIAELDAEPERRLIAADPPQANVLSLWNVAELRAYDFPMSDRHAAFMYHVLEINPDGMDGLPLGTLFSERAVRILSRTGAPAVLVPESAAHWLDCEMFGENRSIGEEWAIAWFKNPTPFAAWQPREAVREVVNDHFPLTWDGMWFDHALPLVRDGMTAEREQLVVERRINKDPRTVPAWSAPTTCVAESLDSGNAYRIAVPAEARGRDGWVVVRASWDGAWRAFDEQGNKLEVAPAQIKFLAVRTRGDETEIVLRYRPRTFTAALWCCGIGLVGLLAMGAAGLVQSRRERSATTMARRQSEGGMSVAESTS